MDPPTYPFEETLFMDGPILEIKPCRLGPRIQDVEAFWYETVPMCFIVFDHMVYPVPKFLIFKTKNSLISFWG